MKDSGESKSVSPVRRRLAANGDFNSDDKADTSKTVENALVLINTIALLGPITLGDIASELKLNRTVVHRLLVTLQRQCFVIKFGSTYVVGPALIKLAECVLPAFKQIAGPSLRRLAAQTRETVSCAIRDGNSWIVLDQSLDNTHGIHVREELGARYPLHLGAHGHALMATLSDSALAAYYAHTSVSNKIRADIIATKERGYAISRGELRDGVTGIAATGLFENMPFSLAVIMPSVREADSGVHLAPLLDAVFAISSTKKDEGRAQDNSV